MNGFNDLIIITIRFGKTDIDLISWLSLIPERQFSFYARKALTAFVKDDELNLGTVVIDYQLKPVKKSFAIAPQDAILINWKKSIFTSQLSSNIKNIFRKYIVFKVPPSKDNHIPFLPNKHGTYIFIEDDEPHHTLHPLTLPEPEIPKIINTKAEDMELSLLHKIVKDSRK